MMSFSNYLGIIAKYFSGIGQYIIARIKRRIQNPFKLLRSFKVLRIFLRKYFTTSSFYLLLREAPSKMFEMVLNAPLEYAHFVYIVKDKFVTVICFKGPL